VERITLQATYQDLQGWIGEDVSVYIRIPQGRVAKVWGTLGLLPELPGRSAGQAGVRFSVGAGAVVEIGGPTFESAKRHDTGGLLLHYCGGTKVWIQRRVR
jgi:hypothetical protein